MGDDHSQVGKMSCLHIHHGIWNMLYAAPKLNIIIEKMRVCKRILSFLGPNPFSWDILVFGVAICLILI